MTSRLLYNPVQQSNGYAHPQQRAPPVPPPKPNKFYDERMPKEYEGRTMNYGHHQKGGAEAAAPPGDSDTDSGICADSEQSSSSPSGGPASSVPGGGVSYNPNTVLRGGRYNGGSPPSLQYSSAPPPAPPATVTGGQHYHRGPASVHAQQHTNGGGPYSTLRSAHNRYDDEAERDYLTPNSARRLFDNVAVSASPRRLPARPASTNGNSGVTPNGGTIARNGNGGTKQFRVRFADQIASSSAAPAQGQNSVVPQGPTISFANSAASSPSTSISPARTNYDSSSYSDSVVLPNGQFYNAAAAAAKRTLPSTGRGSSALSDPMGSLRGNSPQYINYEPVNERRADSATRGYSIDDVEGLPEPPSYSVAVQRMRSGSIGGDSPLLEGERGRGRQRMRESEAGWAAATPRESVRDTIIRQSIEDTMRLRQMQTEQREGVREHYIRNRSSSLPRGRRSEGEIQPLLRQYQISPSTLASSVDNLHLEEYGNNFMPGEYDEGSLPRRRCLPPLPPGLNQGMIQNQQGIPITNDGVAGGYGRRPAFSRQRRCRGVPEMISRRSASVGRYPSLERDRFVQAELPPVEYAPMQSMESPVRAQLVALDHRGFRTVLIEKVQPGPFGFYIATGVVNGQRGIFISRVSIASLSPILSIGDEIVYVDDELVKGRSLEYVQSLIAGKTAVTIVLLPTVGPPLC